MTYTQPPWNALILTEAFGVFEPYHWQPIGKNKYRSTPHVQVHRAHPISRDNVPLLETDSPMLQFQNYATTISLDSN